MPSPPTACVWPTCVQHTLYTVARRDSQFVYTCVRFVIFCGLRFNHISTTCSHRHLTAPCSARALGQARPTMLCIHLVLLVLMLTGCNHWAGYKTEATQDFILKEVFALKGIKSSPRVLFTLWPPYSPQKPLTSKQPGYLLLVASHQAIISQCSFCFCTCLLFFVSSFPAKTPLHRQESNLECVQRETNNQRTSFGYWTRNESA